MDRRNLLTMSAAAGAGLAMAAPARAAATKTPVRRGRPVTTTDGAQLFVRDWGQGEPVLFLAGWTLTSDMWGYQAAPLSSQGLRCIAYDRRGHGRSEDPGQGYDYDQLADDLDAVIEQLGLSGVTLVAHSMSGGEAVRYMSRHGAKGRVKRVLFLAPTLPFILQTADNPAGVPAAMLDAQRKMLLTDFPGWLDDNTDPFVVPSTSAGMKTWIKGMMVQASMKAMIDCNRAMATTDFRPEMRRINVPCLFVHGDKDASAPLEITSRLGVALIPGAALTVYEGAPHGLFVTHIERLNAEILKFAKG